MADEHHHSALSLRGDLLASEQRAGLLAGPPTDAASVLVTRPVDTGYAPLNKT